MLNKVQALLLLVFLGLAHSVYAQESEEWILYFQSEEEASEFARQHPKQILQAQGDVLKGQFSVEEASAIAKKTWKIERNHQKSAAALPPVNDPSYSEQWGLKSIGYDKITSTYKTTSNVMLGKSIEADEETFTYKGDPFNSTSFIINVNGEKLSRFSIALAANEGSWKLSVFKDNGQLLSSNEGDLNTLDVFLPKDQVFDRLQIVIETKSTWSKPPVIEKLIGVDHLTVAVIDSGVAAHEDLCDNILYSLGKDYAEDFDFPEDQMGHGTHVTGIIAACTNNQKGVSGMVGNAGVDILPLKVLNKNGYGGDFEIAEAVIDAVDAGAEVINLSIAGKGQTSILKESIEYAINNHVSVVAAAGNWSISTSDVYPAAYSGVIAVSAVSPELAKLASSNYGWEIDLSAPGQAIFSTYLKNGYKNQTGTSMAAPFVAGAAALIKLKHPEYDDIQIRNTLTQSARDISVSGYDTHTGYGLLDAAAALEMTSASSINWLSLNDKQPFNTKTEQLLGIGTRHIGKTLVVFTNEDLFSSSKISSVINPIRFSAHIPKKGSTNLFTLVMDSQERILDSNYLRVSHSNMTEIIIFPDAPKHYWASEEIMKAADLGLVNGYNDGTFRPNNDITRKHTTMMLNRLFRWDIDGSLQSPFSDVKQELKIDYLSLLSAYNQGVINGYNNGTFLPNNSLTRGQMALILGRSLQPEGINFTGTRYPFKDLTAETEMDQAVQLLTSAGIITKQDFYRPNEFISRAQFAAMLMRTYDHLNTR